MLILNSVDDLLAHIENVQSNVKKLSGDSLMKMSDFMEINKIEIDENLATAFQYQDIINQQLDATLDAIKSMRSSIDVFSHAYKNDESLVNDNLLKLQEKLEKTLKEAKEKKERFAGKSDEDSTGNEEIEFF